MAMVSYSNYDFEDPFYRVAPVDHLMDRKRRADRMMGGGGGGYTMATGTSGGGGAAGSSGEQQYRDNHRNAEQQYMDKLMNLQMQQQQMAMHPIFHSTQMTHLSSAPIATHQVINHYMDQPMGISQWREHGERHGYWEYFKDKVKREFDNKHAGIQMVFGGHTLVPIMGLGPEDKPEVKKDSDDKVSITPDISIGDKVSIKKHVPIVIK